MTDVLQSVAQCSIEALKMVCKARSTTQCRIHERAVFRHFKCISFCCLSFLCAHILDGLKIGAYNLPRKHCIKNMLTAGLLTIDSTILSQALHDHRHTSKTTYALRLPLCWMQRCVNLCLQLIWSKISTYVCCR